uniref:Transmembrane protein n=1 Tax=Thermogemmatispora argillosa TaxID=2045280 RepID=A0A455T4U6_9CHLR|nr:hypothetical protein KTA_17440 [Thermogemmatispora argillosa]
MTRDADQRPANPRRQRPLLVISSNASTGATADQPSKEGAQREPTREEKPAAPSSENKTTGATAQSSSTRRQPGFFASVTQPAGEQEQKGQNLQSAAGKMRLWRALRLRRGQSPESEAAGAARAGKTPAEAAAKGQPPKAMLRNVKKSQPGQEPSSASRNVPAKSGGQPASSAADQPSQPLLKSRHFLGLLIYIVVATLLEVPLAYLSEIFHLNQILFQFSIFSFSAAIRQVHVIYLVLLVALLIILNRFDLLPSFSRTAAERGKSTAQSGSRSKARAKGKEKETGKGEHDHLYEDYRDLRRYLRRRARKR